MDKNKIRLRYKKLREGIDPDEIENLSIEIANKLLSLPIWHLEYYHLFLTISEKREVDTQPILHILQGKDKNVVLSAADFTDNGLTNYLLTDATVLKKSKWGIPEPVTGITVPAATIDVVFIPLLAFDEKGNRIGYGKGFYDRFLSECTGEVIKIGLSFFEAESELIPASSQDVPLDYCITPKKIYNFKSL